MAIQFLCTGCRQPIEVDDDMAGRPVTCPYCRVVVTTPSASDPTVSAAAQSTGQIAVPGHSSEPLAPVGPPPAPSRLGWVALGCVGLTIICLGYSLIQGFAIASKIPPGTPPEKMMKITQEEAKNHPGLQIVSFVGVCLVPVVGIVCAIVALVQKRQPRWPAVLALVALGLFILMLLGALCAQASMLTRKP